MREGDGIDVRSFRELCPEGGGPGLQHGLDTARETTARCPDTKPSDNIESRKILYAAVS